MLPPTVTARPACRRIRPRGRGRLALGAGDRDDLPLQEAGGEFNFTDRRHPGGSRPRDDREFRWHPGAHHDAVCLREGRWHVPAEFERDAQLAQPGCAGDICPRIGQDHACPARGQQLSGRDAAACGTNDDRAHAVHIVDRHHRSFRVVRLQRAKKTPRITNRTNTFGSLQPSSSK